ncbi:2-succinyl-5-enolpyruvyl-6-hydroxy-3-cyclohexene-1-carboxylic-acid synthase [Sporichthya sp.]|uniref:2-succinyl-5-enolpyruvyl-6-hydroxy-3- cyclohexene-1-carboxylic-acid synthase n=1 Tax=Sporichthya sp. TaxID=65475 RepID=UPI0017B0F23F|nr:2-succinyl-5-enolpyruvyl-6-hydroxy-3-cyclohexene-1-carboxylic-acid synthase [Sporichthya sp.]MBA3741864.1 2-succinyl-5-enolpyruvyl-6-hydroxy-3-cyclohexene-1-carboxylic-acid synthase [Sporichthya sp.]
MNPATAQARVLADELARSGVREAVIAPGSRSGPLALALLDEPRIRVHVRIDERSAGFLALGLAAASRTCVPVVCTSGTAAAALHPAVVEADAAGVGLLVLTADRPPELRGTGASQTIDQVGLYGRAVRMFTEVGVPEPIPGQVAYWRSLVGRAVAASTDGPVHLNVPLREPLTHDGDLSWCEPLDGRADNAPWVHLHRASDRRGPRFGGPDLGAAPERGVVVVGDGAADPLAAVALAEALGWPVLAEPASGARQGPNAVAGYPLLLADAVAGDLVPELVISVGGPGLSRSLLAYVRSAERHIVVDPSHRWADPTRTASLVLDLVPRPGDGTPPGPWLERWRELSKVVGNTIDGVLDDAIEAGDLPEPAVARALGRAMPSGSLLVTGPSRSVRDLELCLPARDDIVVLANRGANGIDGVVSTAIGAALAHQVGGDTDPAYALMGDLTYLYDRNGLVLGPDEPRPDLTLVVVDNVGGGIFSMLPQAGVAGFERVFGTPHSLDLVADAAAAGIPATTASTAADLEAALIPGVGLRVIRVRTDRDATAELHRRLQKAVTAALR